MLTEAGFQVVASQAERMCKHAAAPVGQPPVGQPPAVSSAPFGRGNKFSLPSKVMAAGSAIVSGMVLKRIFNQLQNDHQRKAIIEDLHLNDPVLKGIDKATVLEWYATMMHFAPKMSLDKNTVREVLQGFARFGKVDINTLKMLASTESELAKTDHYNRGGWTSLVDSLSKGVVIAGGMSVI